MVAKMFKSGKKTFVFALIIVLVSSQGICESASALSDAKFLSRIERKNEMLTGMKTNVTDFMEECKKAKNRKGDRAAITEELTTRDFSSFEARLNGVVKDSIKDQEIIRGAMIAPVATGINVVPESHFDKDRDKK